MGKPTDPLVFFTIVYLIGIYAGYKNRKEVGLKIMLWCLISFLIYNVGNFYFFEEVKNASHHGNTIHGWYAKGNASEKLNAISWIFGFPIGTIGIAVYMIYNVSSKNKLLLDFIRNHNLQLFMQACAVETYNQISDFVFH